MNWAALAGLYCFLTGNKDVWLLNRAAHRHKRQEEQELSKYGTSSYRRL